MHTSFLFCVQCDTPTYHPLWVRYEHRDYHPHCWRCYAQHTTGFTAAAAIYEARRIVRSVGSAVTL
jgi:hypothetical protein